MILHAISSHIKIDEISSWQENDYVHFLTRPMNGFELPETWDSTVYTSQLITQVLNLDQSPIMDRCVFGLQPNAAYEIITAAGERVLVTLLQSDSASGNVMFLFKDASGKKVLYTGEFTEWRSMESALAACKSVDYMYLDNMFSESTERSVAHVESAASTVKAIQAKFPKHKLVLRLPCFGYEELLLELVRSLKTRIGVGLHRYRLLFHQNKQRYFRSGANRARIYVETNPDYTVEQFSENFANDLITIQVANVSQSTNLPAMYQQNGLYHINYNPHPSYVCVKSLLELVMPQRVVPIFNDGPVFRHITGHYHHLTDSRRFTNNNCYNIAVLTQLPTPVSHRKRIQRVRSPTRKRLCPKPKPRLIYYEE